MIVVSVCVLMALFPHLEETLSAAHRTNRSEALTTYPHVAELGEWGWTLAAEGRASEV
jgi:hypothetical protein